MEKLIGMIEEKSSKGGEKDGNAYTRYAFKIGGKTLSSFDDEMGKFEPGENVEVEYNINGKFNNIVTMEKSNETPTEVPPTSNITNVTNTSNQTSPNTEASIVSQVILKCVSEMVSSGQIKETTFRQNTMVLVEAYKEIKKELLK